MTVQNTEIEESIHEIFKKMVSIFNIDALINELVRTFITTYHAVHLRLPRTSLPPNLNPPLGKSLGSQWRSLANLLMC
jgi:hypothetical protein